VQLERLWQTSVPRDRYYATPLLHEGLIYAMTQSSHMTSSRPRPGRSSTSAGSTSAPQPTELLLAGGKLFASSESGKTVVFEPGREFREVAVNTLESFRSTPVFAGSRIYIRGLTHLWCLERGVRGPRRRAARRTDRARRCRRLCGRRNGLCRAGDFLVAASGPRGSAGAAPAPDPSGAGRTLEPGPATGRRARPARGLPSRHRSPGPDTGTGHASGRGFDNTSASRSPSRRAGRRAARPCSGRSRSRGHAGAAVRGGRVYLLDFDEGSESDVLRCLSLADGREIWRRWYRTGAKRNHGVSRTVPAVSDRWVVTIGPRCQVLCAGAERGEFLWGSTWRASTAPPSRSGTRAEPAHRGRHGRDRAGGRALMIGVEAATGGSSGRLPTRGGGRCRTPQSCR